MTDQAHAMQIADRLVALRKQNGISQEALADQLGVSRQAVSKWETGQALPDTEKLIRLADMYQVSLDELLKKDTPITATQSTNTASQSTNGAYKPQEDSWEEDEWCAVEPQEQETSNAPATIVIEGQTFTKPELADEIIYSIAAFIYLGVGLYWGIWSHMWIVFPIAYLVTLIFKYRGAK